MDTDSRMVKYALVEHKPIWLNSGNKTQTVEIIRYYFTKEEAFSGLEAFFDSLRRRHDRTALALSTFEVVGMDEAAPVSELYGWDETAQSGIKIAR